MKNWLIFFLSILPILSSAQSSAGIRTGVLSLRFEHNSGAESLNKIGVELGVIINFTIIKGLYFQPELTYLQKGGRLDFYIDELTVKTNQIEITALLGYEFKFKQVTLFTNIGAFAGYIFGTPVDNDPFEDIKLSQSDKSVDWGGLIGIGAGVSLGKGQIFIESRYRHTLNELRRSTYGLRPTDPLFGIILKNRNWGVNLGYKFFF